VIAAHSKASCIIFSRNIHFSSRAFQSQPNRKWEHFWKWKILLKSSRLLGRSKLLRLMRLIKTTMLLSSNQLLSSLMPQEYSNKDHLNKLDGRIHPSNRTTSPLKRIQRWIIQMKNLVLINLMKKSDSNNWHLKIPKLRYSSWVISLQSTSKISLLTPTNDWKAQNTNVKTEGGQFLSLNL